MKFRNCSRSRLRSNLLWLLLALESEFFDLQTLKDMGRSSVKVDSMVASDTQGPGFRSSHRQLLLNNYLLLNVCRKDGNKEKEAGNGR